jgi:hypothetical protein
MKRGGVVGAGYFKWRLKRGGVDRWGISVEG